MSDAPAIVVSDGTVELGGRPVLRGVDLTLRSGEVVAMLGANGSGKSTLVRSLVGLVPLVRGEIRLFGTPLGRFSDWHRLGFVPQRSGAGGGVPATVREVVASGRLSRRRLLRPLSATDRAAVDDAIGSVGLAARAGDGVATLSGGQQQRVLIARALAGQPDVFLLDEPTAGVDSTSQEAFAHALTGLVDRGATVLVVLHELGPLAPLIDRTVVMRDGRIAYDGAPLADFHAADATHEHAHHHPSERPGPEVDHVPAVGGPFDLSRRPEEDA